MARRPSFTGARPRDAEALAFDAVAFDFACPRRQWLRWPITTVCGREPGARGWEGDGPRDDMVALPLLPHLGGRRIWWPDRQGDGEVSRERNGSSRRGRWGRRGLKTNGRRLRVVHAINRVAQRYEEARERGDRRQRWRLGRKV